MHNAISGSNGLSPDRMSAEERLAELGRILATGLRRNLVEQSSPLSATGGDSSLDILALQSSRGHRKPRCRVGG
jgi:hypothetical protein